MQAKTTSKNYIRLHIRTHPHTQAHTKDRKVKYRKKRSTKNDSESEACPTEQFGTFVKWGSSILAIIHNYKATLESESDKEHVGAGRALYSAISHRFCSGIIIFS